MQVVGFARAGKHCDFAGQYLEWFDPNIPDECEIMATFTRDLAKAKRFANAADAMIEWGRVRDVDPVRLDGRPNKPLTALTVDIHEEPQ